jgi:hypothetical protein
VLLHIERVYTTHHVIKLTGCTKFNKINIINGLIEMCDALWVPRKEKGEFCMRTKRNKEYSLKDTRKPFYCLPYFFLPLTKRTKVIEI